MTGRPRKPDPDGKYAKRRARDKLRYALRLLNGEQVTNYGHHHSGMRHLKGLLEDGVPAQCHCGDEQVTLSLVDRSQAYWGVRYLDGKPMPYLLSADSKAYIWECHHHNTLRGHPTLETNAGMDPALD